MNNNGNDNKSDDAISMRETLLSFVEEQNAKEREISVRKKGRSMLFFKIKMMSFIIYSIGLFGVGIWADLSIKISNMLLDLSPGSVISVIGSCRTNDNGVLTLNRDQLTIVKNMPEKINAIINESGIMVNCVKKDIHLEAISITGLFKKELKFQASSSKEIFYDSLTQIVNKAIIITGECSTSNGKKIVSNRLMDVVSVDGGVIIGVLPSESLEISCNKNSRYKIVTDGDYDKFLKIEKDFLKPKIKTTLVGKFAKVSGTCIVEDYKKETKKPLIELLDKVVKVTKETLNGITGVTTNSGATITVLCDKEIMNNVYYEELLDTNFKKNNDEPNNNKENTNVSQ